MHEQQKHKKKFTEGLLNSDIILKNLNIKTDQTILDAGCGTGYMSKLFSGKISQAGKVYALDLDQNFLNVLKNETKGTNIQVVEADITTPTGIKESSIDLIYISTVIHIFSNQQMQGFIQETKRLLKPNALLAIVEIEKKETPFGPPLKMRYSPEELKKIIPMTPGNTIQVGEHFYMQLFNNPES